MRRERLILLQRKKQRLWERHSAKVLLGSVSSLQLSDCFGGRNRQALAFREALVTYIPSFNSRGHERVAKEARAYSQTPLEPHHATKCPLETEVAVAGALCVLLYSFAGGQAYTFLLGLGENDLNFS